MNTAGNPGPTELPSAISWDPRTGYAITRRWRGDLNGITALANVHKQAGAKIEITEDDDHAIASLNALYGAEESQPPGEPLSDEWSLAGNDLEKSIWEHPEIVRVTHGYSTAYDEDSAARWRIWADFKSDVAAFVDGQRERVNMDGETVTLTLVEIVRLGQTLGFQQSTVQKLVACLLRGVEAFTVSQWVLRHTTVIAANASIRPSLLNVGKVYQTPVLSTVEAIPDTIKFDLPAGWWLKRTPTIEQTAADKWTIVQEWWHADSYDPFIYEVAT